MVLLTFLRFLHFRTRILTKNATFFIDFSEKRNGFSTFLRFFFFFIFAHGLAIKIKIVYRFSGLLDFSYVNSIKRLFKKNTKEKSKENISKHYDLGNEFFSL